MPFHATRFGLAILGVSLLGCTPKGRDAPSRQALSADSASPALHPSDVPSASVDKPSAPTSAIQPSLTPDTTALLSSAEFPVAWPALMTILGASNTADRDVPIDPSLGVHLLDNPGAFVVLSKHASLGEVRPQMPSFSKCVLKDARKLPKYSCEKEAWSETGCLHVAGRFAPLVKVARDQVKLVEGRSATKEDQANFAVLKHLDEQISDAVFVEGTTFYFGRVAGVWRLIAIDAVTPCSA